MHRWTSISGGLCLVLTTGASAQVNAPAINAPPVAPRGTTADTIHGFVLHDPYRWMEDTRSSETIAWIRSQDAYTRRVLSEWPGRTAARARMAASTVPVISRAPIKEGNRYFYSRNRGAGPQVSYSLFVREAGSSAEHVILTDDSLLAATGVHIRSAVPSPDGRLLAYSVAQGGNVHESVRVRDIDAGRDLPDSVAGVDGAQGTGSFVWARAGAPGFYYTQFTRQARTTDSSGKRPYPKIYFHRLGSASSTDELVFARPDHPEWIFTSHVSDDGRFLLVSAQTGVERRHRIFARDLRMPGGTLAPLIPEGDAEFFFVGNHADTLLFQTTFNAPNGQIVAVPFANPARQNWRTVIAESRDAIDTWIGTKAIGDRLFVTYRRDAVLVAKMFDSHGALVSDIKFDQPFNSMWAAGGRQTDSEGFFVLQGVADPGTVYSIDPRNGRTREFSRPALPYDPHDFITEQVFFTSKDGTRVPMYVVHHKATKLDGSAPGILYGYGFNGWAGSPWFQPMITEWMREGGVWALANIRGGGEYGPSWELAGRRLRKQTSIDDYLAAAEFLIAKKLVAPGRLVANSSSAGGVVAAAAVIQRPRLFGASILDYPVIDMMRYHLFSGGARWTQEYGTVGDANDFAVLRAYDPLRSVAEGVCYPPVLLAPGEKDMVATPMHAYKLTAALQSANANTIGCSSDTLLRVSWGAGHNAGATAEDQFDTWADELAFLWKTVARR